MFSIRNCVMMCGDDWRQLASYEFRDKACPFARKEADKMLAYTRLKGRVAFAGIPIIERLQLGNTTPSTLTT